MKAKETWIKHIYAPTQTRLCWTQLSKKGRVACPVIISNFTNQAKKTTHEQQQHQKAEKDQKYCINRISSTWKKS